ncbi:MAG: fructose-bisphosphatase class III, partial [Firmicutes bacterium]|nr:fructose-bisphosphatase class III [Bacillota bacterium]
IMYKVLSKLAVEITDENAENHVTADDLMDFTYWMQDGGGVTMEQFRRLDAEEQADILDYISDASAYEIVRTGGKRYVLVHAGINDFQPGKALDDYDYSDFLFYRADYGRRYFKDQNTYLVTGHTPTPSIREDKEPEVYRENGHIAMDCGCFFSGRLACLCLETGEVVYSGDDKENLSQE